METFKEHLSSIKEGTKVDTTVDTTVDTDAKDPEPKEEEVKFKFNIKEMLKRLQARRPDIRV